LLTSSRRCGQAEKGAEEQEEVLTSKSRCLIAGGDAEEQEEVLSKSRC
jgi:hypothetical protein